MENDLNTTRDTAWRILDVVLSVVAMALLAVVTFVLVELVDIKERVTAIESNRFTTRDALQLSKAIADLRENIAAMPRESPPTWFLQRVDQIDDKIEAIDTQLDHRFERIDGRLDQIERGIHPGRSHP